jgi:hypothetical protein
MPLQLLWMLLAVLQSLLLGLQLLHVWMLVLLLLLLLSFSPPSLPPVFLPFLPPRIGWPLATLHTHAQRIGTGDVDALVPSVRFKNHSGPGACSDTLLVLRQEALGSRTKRENSHFWSCYPVEASGRRRPSHTAVSALRLRPLSSALPADSVENCIFEIEITYEPDQAH